jgi:hypothetical protein
LYFPEPRPRCREWVAPGAAAAWHGVATPGELGKPGDLPVSGRQQLRRWGALLALAGMMTVPGSGAAQATEGRTAGAVVETSRSDAPRTTGTAGDAAASKPVSPGGIPSGDAGEAGVVEADGKPLPTAPPPGPVPVQGTPQVATTGPTPPSRARDLVPDDREYLGPILIRYAQANGLPADLVMALAWVESSWRRTAVSDVGAVGVMQLMPVTVGYVSQKLLGLRSNLDPGNATSNVRMGTRYLRALLDQNKGNVRQALIAYNQGLTSLMAQGSYGAAERYADRVLALRPVFRSW